MFFFIVDLQIDLLTLKRKLSCVVAYAYRMPWFAEVSRDDVCFLINSCASSERLLSERCSSSFTDKIIIIACDYARSSKLLSPAVMQELRFTG